jgi:hypothetical protein
VRRGRCQSRDAAPPTPVRLTRRALEGGPAAPSTCFLVILQGLVEALGRWDAIPATVNGMAAAPARTNHTPGAVATTLALWIVWE